MESEIPEDWVKPDWFDAASLAFVDGNDICVMIDDTVLSIKPWDLLEAVVSDARKGYVTEEECQKRVDEARKVVVHTRTRSPICFETESGDIVEIA